MIAATQAIIFVLRMALVIRVAMLGTWQGWAVAVIGIVALATTIMAWIQGKPDMTWRGCTVGWSYLAVCLMNPGPIHGTIAIVFWMLFAFQIASKIRLGKRCTVTGPVFVNTVSGFPYSVMRHPMTAAEWGMAAVIWTSAPTLHNAIAFAVVSVMNILAIHAEETFLATMRGYRAYMKQTPWRIMPGIW